MRTHNARLIANDEHLLSINIAIYYLFLYDIGQTDLFILVLYGMLLNRKCYLIHEMILIRIINFMLSRTTESSFRINISYFWIFPQLQ